MLKVLSLVAPIGFLGCRTQSSQESEAKWGPFDKSSKAKLTQPDPGAAYKEVDKRLVIYDACLEKWTDTGLEYRANPTFPETPVSNQPYGKGTLLVAGAKKYRLYEVDGRNFETKMYPAKDPIPRGFHGIWWMEGNPTPEVIVNFANGSYNKADNVFTFQYASDNAYLFPSSTKGADMFARGVDTNTPTEVKFENGVDLNAMKYGQKGSIALRFVGGSAMSSIHVADGLWRRNSYGIHCYNLRRIVDEKGQKLPMFDYYASKLAEINSGYGSTTPFVLLYPVEVKE